MSPKKNLNQMLFAKGSRVRLNHTGDEGTVSDLLDNGMVNDCPK